MGDWRYDGSDGRDDDRLIRLTSTNQQSPRELIAVVPRGHAHTVQQQRSEMKVSE